MKALVKSKAETGIWLEEVPIPEVGQQDVLIKIKKTAICGTDIHIYNWDDWAQKNIKVPLVVGHEFVGTVAEVGAAVKTHFKVGDRVSGEGHIACQFCRNCRSGRAHLCRSNISVGCSRAGAYAEYLSIPAQNVYPIPDDIPDQVGAILDPLGNATHTALSFDLVGEDVLITGAGPIGIMAAIIARHAGARFVVITDVNDYRLQLAKKMGVAHAINTRKTPLKDIMATLGMKEGFDVGFEMSGNATAMGELIAHMNHAGKVALLGLLPDQTAIDWNTVIMRGLVLKGIYGREMYETWYKMISMLQSGLPIAPIITHEFHYTDFQKAFDTMRQGQSGKVIMNWSA
jgi:threonine 3-dehydrogenase